jgi:penicillin-binding protein 1A
MAQAGKTGTTTNNRDSLFAGYTPYYTSVVWGGNDDNSIQNGSQCTYARNIWRESMKRIHADLEYKDFDMPTSISTATVCKESGLLPLVGSCEACQKGNATYTEYFANGTVPTATCDHHVTLEICSATGKIANANCPASGIVKKVFIIGADPATADGPYIATEAFLSTICTHQATNATDAEKQNEEEEDSDDASFIKDLLNIGN